MAEAEVIREGFGERETRSVVETSSAAVAAQAQAQVQARYVMAMQRPRDWDLVRTRLLKECKRSGFAATALYNKPVGDGITGPSIRFAEAALRCMTNVLPEVSTLYDDSEKRIIKVSVTDLEANVTYSKDVVVSKTVERNFLKNGQVPLSKRVNSRGKQVYIIEATDDEILNKENALISKAIRTSGLRLLPGDILDECMAIIRATREAEIAADPDAARKKIVDSFDSIGVPPDQLKKYLGHDLSTASPAELDELRALFAAIRDGEATWAEAMDSKAPAEGEEDQKKRNEAAASLREKLAKQRERRSSKSTPENGGESA